MKEGLPVIRDRLKGVKNGEGRKIFADKLVRAKKKKG